MATSESKALTVADVEELAKSLGTLSDEELGKLKALLCPSTVTAELGLKGILQSWIKNEPNPTREKLLQQTRKLQTEVNIPLETDGEARETDRERESGKEFAYLCIEAGRFVHLTADCSW